MKILILSLCLLCGLSGCANFSTQKVEPWVEPTVLMAVVDSPKNARKAVKLADAVDGLVDTVTRELVLADFVQASQTVGVEVKWAIIVNSFYGIYKEKLNANLENRLEAVAGVKVLTKKVRDTASLFVTAQK